MKQDNAADKSDLASLDPCCTSIESIFNESMLNIDSMNRARLGPCGGRTGT